MGDAPDESKLKKGVRKLLVFLHPDKVPRDLIYATIHCLEDVVGCSK